MNTLRLYISNKTAWRESVFDTTVALLLNLPLNMVLIYCCRKLEFNVFQTSVILSIIFTIVAIIRKYCIRVFF